MNIISIVNGIVNEAKISDKLKIDEHNICVNILSDTDLYLQIDGNKDAKIKIILDKNVSFRMFNFSETKDCDIEFYIEQKQGSTFIMNSFYKNEDTKIITNIDLNGTNSKLEYNFSCLGETTKELRINHNYSNTNSIVKSHGVSIDKKIEFKITEFVPKESINCTLSQSSKIINLGENKCSIKPILLIDEKDVNASHSSIVTKISDDDLLYLMSRGLKKDIATNLLVNGFLMSNLSLKNEEKHILFEKHIFRR